MISNLTHWGRVTHICVSKSTIIGSDNGLSPGRRQAIIWTNAGILSTGPLGTNFSEILIEILTFLFKKMHLKMSSAKWRPFCLRLNVLLTQSTLAYWCMCLAAMVITAWFRSWLSTQNVYSHQLGLFSIYCLKPWSQQCCWNMVACLPNATHESTGHP